MKELLRNKKELADRLKKVRAQIKYADRQYTRLKQQERKSQTRQKISLGGLIVKAGLQEETSATLLGILLQAKERLENQETGEHFRSDCKLLGDIAFTK